MGTHLDRRWPGNPGGYTPKTQRRSSREVNARTPQLIGTPTSVHAAITSVIALSTAAFDVVLSTPCRDSTTDRALGSSRALHRVNPPPS